ncbi:MAG: hypothetical protein EXX96DRAFT_535242 [Benjaminiella poitrasii]|nr:MAG: hypothetical protein EXX96DRAFT_535242 [Benjaminiella poitrasii]
MYYRCAFLMGLLMDLISTVAGFLFSFEKTSDYEKQYCRGVLSLERLSYTVPVPENRSFHALQCSSDLFACSLCVSALMINQTLDTLALTRSKLNTQEQLHAAPMLTHCARRAELSNV